ncbi:hypothetical protein [Methanobacterium sp. CWC-01]|uniref:hypothetical protein n=1 Tax=Methanobacterium aridiramus TaxID=2584467 RepID=UPI002576751D|nr:hypothetical protein [Methanobacterium sp. CWC-01]
MGNTIFLQDASIDPVGSESSGGNQKNEKPTSLRNLSSTPDPETIPHQVHRLAH